MDRNPEGPAQPQQWAVNLKLKSKLMIGSGLYTRRNPSESAWPGRMVAHLPETRRIGDAETHEARRSVACRTNHTGFNALALWFWCLRACRNQIVKDGALEGVVTGIIAPLVRLL